MVVLSCFLDKVVVSLFVYRCSTNLTLSALNVNAGAYIQYDAGLGDDLSKEGSLVEESESIMPFPDDQEDSDGWLKPIPIASPAALIGNARPPRQMWTPFYWFLI